MANQDVYLLGNFTRFYDWSYMDREEDIPFYVRMARECGSPVLEVACGTGRVLIPLAREGFEVVGIDFSEHMLGIGRAPSWLPARLHRPHVARLPARPGWAP